MGQGRRDSNGGLLLLLLSLLLVLFFLTFRGSGKISDESAHEKEEIWIEWKFIFDKDIKKTRKHTKTLKKKLKNNI